MEFRVDVVTLLMAVVCLEHLNQFTLMFCPGVITQVLQLGYCSWLRRGLWSYSSIAADEHSSVLIVCLCGGRSSWLAEIHGWRTVCFYCLGLPGDLHTRPEGHGYQSVTKNTHTHKIVLPCKYSIYKVQDDNNGILNTNFSTPQGWYRWWSFHF